MAPKSYLSDAEREALRSEGLTQDSVYLAESEAAEMAGDYKSSWAWLAHAELPAHSLLFIKHRRGARFIRDMGFRTANADATYGPGWLDHASLL